MVDLDKQAIQKTGEIGWSRCLHKIYMPKSKYQDIILLFGGNDNNSIEAYAWKKNKIECQETNLRKVVEDFKFEMELVVADIFLKKYLLI